MVRRAPLLHGRISSWHCNQHLQRWILLREETLAKVDIILSKALPPPSDPSINPPLLPEQHSQLADRLRDESASGIRITIKTADGLTADDTARRSRNRKFWHSLDDGNAFCAQHF